MNLLEHHVISYEVKKRYTDEHSGEEIFVVDFDTNCYGTIEKNEREVTESQLKKIIKAGKYLA